MFQLEDIHPLTDFQRNAKTHLSRVNKTGRPEVLTVNGRAEAVLLGRKTYEKLNEALEELAAIKSIQVSLKQMAAGKTIPAKAVHQRLRKL
ncbi:MAG: type II toxin-antitoxin system Phd/YefM family antitoxin [Prosthecobacter sp.]|jgi:prevent-host-death family protein|uniref:type II toxin-antitoxin system Phd/YefM family antitoxin n=1 Tax=Prosthecobacter sp. TaxID=1965333 RepID=UPI0019F2CA46|nr:type II toxin-antitoxin system Phd/YefM family antitoxin [Prosthecobacter sp.]MBE2287239.1 type II toxin-antitoxin system Phd/YefM family antitoxin [Prosthecobacter sp.]